MNDSDSKAFKRRVGAERVVLMMPFNVAMVARIRGNVEVRRLGGVVEQLRKRHALLAVRVFFDENNVAWFVSEGVPAFHPHIIRRHSEDQWIEHIEAKLKNAFPLEEGPLVRFTLIHSPGLSELIVCAHHAVCDGLSLAYLIRDILQHLGDPDRPVEILPEPPPIDPGTVPSPPTTKPLAQKIINIINRKWLRKNIRFDRNDREKLHRIFWEKRGNVKLLPWTVSQEMTDALAARCRKEEVTVNTALWAAFLAAQHDVQAPLKTYQWRSALAVNTRNRLNVPVGEAFGFYASSLTVRLKYWPRKDFWENARHLHRQIHSELDRTDLFRMLRAEFLPPGLLDSLYFSKYGLIDSRISNRLLKKMGWHRITYGYAITNVGRIDMPDVYGPLRLEALHGPSVYSDVEEKIIGVITVKGSISFMMTFNETTISTHDARQIRDFAMQHLLNAVDVS
ncbi:MAG: hypothetical protein JXA41_05040 [Deltaproteobacteria bacterium]|nr:hypothetical protein [Deltaproteobacteria bacterium]